MKRTKTKNEREECEIRSRISSVGFTPRFHLDKRNSTDGYWHPLVKWECVYVHLCVARPSTWSPVEMQMNFDFLTLKPFLLIKLINVSVRSSWLIEVITVDNKMIFFLILFQEEPTLPFFGIIITICSLLIITTTINIINIKTFVNQTYHSYDQKLFKIIVL